MAVSSGRFSPVVPQSMQGRHATGDQTGSIGHAYRRGDIGTIKADTPGRQPVDIGCLENAGPIATEVICPLLIGTDDQEVRTPVPHFGGSREGSIAARSATGRRKENAITATAASRRDRLIGRSMNTARSPRRQDQGTTKIVLKQRSEHEAEQQWCGFQPCPHHEIAEEAKQENLNDVIDIAAHSVNTHANEHEDDGIEVTVGNGQQSYPDADQGQIHDEQQ